MKSNINGDLYPRIMRGMGFTPQAAHLIAKEYIAQYGKQANEELKKYLHSLMDPFHGPARLPDYSPNPTALFSMRERISFVTVTNTSGFMLFAPQHPVCWTWYNSPLATSGATATLNSAPYAYNLYFNGSRLVSAGIIVTYDGAEQFQAGNFVIAPIYYNVGAWTTAGSGISPLAVPPETRLITAQGAYSGPAPDGCFARWSRSDPNDDLILDMNLGVQVQTTTSRRIQTINIGYTGVPIGTTFHVDIIRNYEGIVDPSYTDIIQSDVGMGSPEYEKSGYLNQLIRENSGLQVQASNTIDRSQLAKNLDIILTKFVNPSPSENLSNLESLASGGKTAP